MTRPEEYMQRCLELAAKGAGKVAPNPMVGAVLVYQDRIIGEGWHEQYGQAHAEVNCIHSVKEEDRCFIKNSVLYVSLEPCAHYGKTPPCADLIITHQIPEVYVGCSDSYKEVAGRGIARLRAAGVKVVTCVLEQACRWGNRRFFTRQEYNRPYIILKWAQSADGYIAPPRGQRVMLSHPAAQKMVHQMRSEESAILVGYQTAILDNPELNNRLWTGPSPTRMVIDPQLHLPQSLKLFQPPGKTIIFNYLREKEQGHLQWKKILPGASLAREVVPQCTHITSLLVEGGRKTLQDFIDSGLWDEAFLIHTPAVLGTGTPAPQLQEAVRVDTFPLPPDTVSLFLNRTTATHFRNHAIDL